MVTEPNYLKHDEPFIAIDDEMKSNLQSLQEEIAMLDNDYRVMSQLAKIATHLKRQYEVRYTIVYMYMSCCFILIGYFFECHGKPSQYTSEQAQQRQGALTKLRATKT